MRYRPMVAIAAAAAIAAAMPASAAVKTLDGKKTKAIAFSLKSSPQSNDTNVVTDVTSLAVSTPLDRPANMATCPKKRCLRYSFRYAPARGVKAGPFSVKITWSLPGEDYDLYVYVDGGEAGHCGASAGTSEVVYVDTPLRNKTYTVIIDQYRALPDTVKGAITFPAKNRVGSTAPPQPDAAGLPVNCGLS